MFAPRLRHICATFTPRWSEDSRLNKVFMQLLSNVFGQRTRRGRCPIEQRGEFSVRPNVRPSERTNERTNERPSGPLRVQPPPPPQPLSPLQAPRPLETLPRPQLPCSRSPATPPFPPGPISPYRAPAPHGRTENSPLCSIGHRPLRVRCPA